MIISFIGVNGAGKSTQSTLLRECILFRGGSAEVVKPLDEKTKELFGDIIKSNSLDANISLFCGFYRQQADRVARLKSEGVIVITDRYIESFLLFHRMYGLLKTNQMDLYNELEAVVFGDVKPDVYVYLKVDIATANDRISRRNRSDENFETTETFNESIKLFEEIAHSTKCIIVDGHMSEIDVHNQIRAALEI